MDPARQEFMAANRVDELEERQHLFRPVPWLGGVDDLTGGHVQRGEQVGGPVHVEAGAILYELGRQPRAAREFFIEYQDRILFGKDSFQPSEYPYYWRVFETDDEYFDYYRDYHAFWKMYGMDLPDEVLRKVYYENALELFDRIPEEGFP